MRLSMHEIRHERDRHKNEDNGGGHFQVLLFIQILGQRRIIEVFLHNRKLN
jgi:hypothetical protein